MQKSNFFCLYFLSICLILLLSCTKTSNEGAVDKVKREKEKVVIGFSIDTLALERWQRDLDIFIDTVGELGGEVIVQNAGNSIEMQNKQLLYLLSKKVDSVVILAKKCDTLSESIQKFRSKNIPVIAYDRLITKADISMYISVNTQSVGEIMAKNMLKRSTGGNWFCILGPEDDYNMTLLHRGIQNGIKNTGIRIVQTYFTQGWNYDVSYQEAVNVITGKITPNAIICGNDAVAGSVIQAVSDYYGEKHIPICGQDADIAACQNIVRGKQEFTVYKPITSLSAKAAECAVLLAKGIAVEDLPDIKEQKQTIDNGFAEIPVVWLEPKLVTKENIDSVIIDTGFHTKGEIYGQSNY